MIKSLEERLNDAQSGQMAIDSVLAQHPGKLRPEVESAIRKVLVSSGGIEHWMTLIHARKSAWSLIEDLENKVDSEDCVNFGSSSMKFVHARLLGVQAYLTCCWSLADQIIGWAGRVLCTPNGGLNESSPPQLVSHFLRSERKKHTLNAFYGTIPETFGWPIGIFYALRNHFVHDGGQKLGVEFFESPNSMRAFEVSNEAWLEIEEVVRNKYNLEITMQTNTATWPDNPLSDIREVFKVCERESDDALGIILGSACATLKSHVGLMLGQD